MNTFISILFLSNVFLTILWFGMFLGACINQNLTNAFLSLLTASMCFAASVWIQDEME